MEIKEVWADTGEEVIREATPEELAQREIDEANMAAAAQAEAEKVARRAEILERLGLTEDEAKLILG